MSTNLLNPLRYHLDDIIYWYFREIYPILSVCVRPRVARIGLVLIVSSLIASSSRNRKHSTPSWFLQFVLLPMHIVTIEIGYLKIRNYLVLLEITSGDV